MKTDETNPQDWFFLGRERLAAADAVRQVCGAGSSAVELLQEAVERYLKGFLVANGWSLQRIHNLSALPDAAMQRDARFRAFADLCDSLTAQFWEQHYPGGDLTEVGADYDQLRQQVTQLLELIPGATGPASQSAGSQ
jgi:HEPN domain-containing protein